MPTIRKGKVTIALAACLWLTCVALGTARMWRHESQAGAPVHAESRWPLATSFAPAPNTMTLVMALHPNCPCSRASVGELAKLMAHCQRELTAYVLFVAPPGAPPGWEKTDLWSSAARIPGVQVMVDRDGHNAQRLGAATSGSAVLYDAAGNRLFEGGITASRGHAGDNDGASAIRALVHQRQTPLTQTPVFGCPLLSPEQAPAKPNHDSSL